MFYRPFYKFLKSLAEPNYDIRLTKGDHIKSSQGIYEHHGIYTGDGTVVQRTRNGVDEVSLKKFSDDHFIEVVHHEDMKGNREEVVRRARCHIGEDDYNLLFNNCEHFSNEMVSGKASSEQVESGLRSVTFGICLLTLTGITKFLKNQSSFHKFH